ncbi:hypothetical protein CV102_05715 [Natronococcus pandeyae]|uniref:Uncharacterized protein n=1 Tax=Natronococcus pandeyae TaxID=2055836 RepID=A0A8J8Q9G5_9EURY|nr:hypothetical protein [Natronococcus pandeyae]TYL39780.1 hypothetical protein CV102_05715 [Natronococcus pandeyae]
MALELSSATDEIDWARVAERLLYLFPPVIGVGIVGILQDVEPGVPGLQWGLVLFSSFGYTFLSLGLAAALFLDARRVRRRPQASGHWQPNPLFNAIFALLWAPVAGVVYLFRRHRRFGTPPAWSGWWLVVAVSLAATLIGTVAAVIAVVFSLPRLLTTAVGLAGAISFGAFPVAIHQDAAYVCTRADSWRPNPGLYLGFAFLSLFVPPLQPMLAGYYLLRRRRALGVP